MKLGQILQQNSLSRFQCISLILFVCILLLSACFNKTNSSSVVTSAPAAPALFSGVTQAVNSASGLSIQVSWAQASSPYVSYTLYQVGAGNVLTPLQSGIGLGITSFTHQNLTSGTLYSYVVRAFDATGKSDGNLNIVSTLAYSGVTPASSALALSSATVNFAPSGPNSQGVHVYCSYGSQNSFQLVATVLNPSATSASLSGLISGTNYVCRVNAIIAQTGSDDLNTNLTSFQTLSQGFTQATPAYRGVVLVQAYGDAPNAPTASTAPAYNSATSSGIQNPVVVPTVRQVNIIWNNFAVPNPAQAQYRLVRVAQGGVFNMNTSALCTATTNTACQVCLSTNQTTASSRLCQDLTIATSPARYEYAVSLIVNPSTNPPLAEELPTSPNDAPFRILVPIPPINMVLVHRDSVNAEICNMMNLVTDPLNHQRCSYTGLGAVPYCTFAGNACTPLNLPTNYYDFGYNLFVDRFGVGCNWTPATAGGMCGAGGTSGDCYSGSNTSSVPSNTLGVNGNVWVNAYTADCLYKLSGAWQYAYNISQPSINNAISTNAPSTTLQRPNLSYVTQATAWGYCQARIDPYYGPARLFRRREFIAASEFQRLPGEPNAMSPAGIYSMMNGQNLTATQACNTNNANGVGGANSQTFNNNFQRHISSTSGNDFVIGSHYTAQCVSRFGAQDLIGNIDIAVSDQYVCTGGSTCTTQTSTLDGGNRDFNFTSTYNFDGLTGPGGTSAGQTGPGWTGGLNFVNKNYGANYFSVPMGLPFVSNDHGNALAVGSAIGYNQFFNTYFGIGTSNNAVLTLHSGADWGDSTNGGRFSGWVNGLFGQAHYLGFRCVIPAE